MTEDPRIIELSIRHYQELLKLDRHTPETRKRVTALLAEAQEQLAAADAAPPHGALAAGLSPASSEIPDDD